MVRVTVLYPNESAKRFDHDYYARKHMPMVMERLKGSGMLRRRFPEGDRRPRHGDHGRHSELHRYLTTDPD